MPLARPRSRTSSESQAIHITVCFPWYTSESPAVASEASGATRLSSWPSEASLARLDSSGPPTLFQNEKGALHLCTDPLSLAMMTADSFRHSIMPVTFPGIPLKRHSPRLLSCETSSKREACNLTT